MKYLLLLICLPMSAFAINCEVGGISDSPQKMNCYISDGKLIESLSLICSEGQYLLSYKGKSHPVDVAYHEEVESGSNPLVFNAADMSLRTIAYRLYSRADLTINDKTLNGLCFKN